MTAIPDERLSGELLVLSAAEAAATVDDGETVAVSGFGGVGYPKAVPSELVERQSLSVISSGGVGKEVDDVLVESGAMERRAHFQTRQPVRDAINNGKIEFFDCHVSQFGDVLRFRQGIDVDVAIVEAVAVGEGWFVPSASLGHVPAIVEAADRLVIELNRAQPLALAGIHDVYNRANPPNREPIALSEPIDRIGTNRVEFAPDSLYAVVETEQPDDPYAFREPTETDLMIASQLGSFLEAEVESNPLLEEAVALQFGVGSLGNALMGAVSDIDFGDRELIYFGEVFQDGLLDMLDDGHLAGASASSLALSSDGQRRFFNAIDRYVEHVVIRPADVSNNPELIERFGVVAVNSAVEVDLYGNANATHLGGTQLVNGIGGGGDFVRNSRLSVITLPSTAADGAISRIVPMTPHVDHTEHDVDIVVTERGIADLRGRSPRERAQVLLKVAHPDYLVGLSDYLERAHACDNHTAHDLESAFDWFVS